MVNHVSECVYKLSYQPNCTRLQIWYFFAFNSYLSCGWWFVWLQQGAGFWMFPLL